MMRRIKSIADEILDLDIPADNHAKGEIVFGKQLYNCEKCKIQAGAERCQAQRGLKGCCEITSTFYIQFRQSFAKETLSYDEHLKS